MQKLPACWYLWRWVKQIFRVLPDAKPKICVSPDANPRCQSVEYRWRWASGVGAGIGHVDFMFFVLISFAFCCQRKPSFRWNMGFRDGQGDAHTSQPMNVVSEYFVTSWLVPDLTLKQVFCEVFITPLYNVTIMFTWAYLSQADKQY